MQFRQGEDPHPVFRTDRFCQINGFWYFVTREQTQEGPFASRQDAQAELQNYIHRVSAPSAGGR